jgi:L-histidine N-alpha-methyltransferase
VFLGGTIGNFDENEATVFLREVLALMRSEDRLLLGADRVKSKAVLEAAYNDGAGVTAAFNKNVLRVLNWELNGDFQPAHFGHRAIYLEDAARIEMHLVSERAQDVHLAAIAETLHLQPG